MDKNEENKDKKKKEEKADNFLDSDVEVPEETKELKIKTPRKIVTMDDIAKKNEQRDREEMQKKIFGGFPQNNLFGSLGSILATMGRGPLMPSPEEIKRRQDEERRRKRFWKIIKVIAFIIGGIILLNLALLNIWALKTLVQAIIGWFT